MEMFLQEVGCSKCDVSLDVQYLITPYYVRGTLAQHLSQQDSSFVATLFRRPFAHSYVKRVCHLVEPLHLCFVHEDVSKSQSRLTDSTVILLNARHGDHRVDLVGLS